MRAYAPLAVIIGLATGLRFYGLDQQSLWSDEGNSVMLARRTFSEIAQRTAFDIHPPLYYWLLKLWTLPFGDSEISLRAFSAGLGVLLILLIYALGVKLANQRVGLLAALIAAISPLQVYYAQEARMYMLLALLGTATMLLGWHLLDGYRREQRLSRFAAGLYIIVVTAGLYTHYAYPLILIAINLLALAIYRRQPHLNIGIQWLTLHLIPSLLYLYWLPTAWRQITTWPTERQALPLLDTLQQVAITLMVGLSWPYELGSLIAVLLGLLLIVSLWLASTSTDWLEFGLLWLWLLPPMILTAIIFSPAFLKFLLVATPPLALLIALTLDRLLTHVSYRPAAYTLGGLLMLALLLPSALSLYQYYNNPRFARDNYRAIVQFIEAVGSDDDAIILNAEGQQDVFRYYYERSEGEPMPVYPLPQSRPLDEAATLDQLEALAADAERVYAVYWASQQADPDGLIEGWLDRRLFKATDQWYGNVRLVSYATPPEAITLTPVEHQLGQHIRLTGYGLASDDVAQGDILQIALEWETDAPLETDYTVFLQLLDGNNAIIGQRDAPPLTPTSAWPVEQPITDAHGLFIEPGTPPGPHRLIVGLYDSSTGQRLPLDDGRDFIELATVEITAPPHPLPPEAFSLQHRLNATMDGLTLLGYELNAVGQPPETPLHVGDVARLVLYWQRDDSLARSTDADALTVRLINRSTGQPATELSLAPVVPNYPIEAWQAGEIVRAQYDISLAGLEAGQYEVVIIQGDETAQTLPFRVVGR